ncbi:class II aldolase/adducin family protein [Nocardioides carbamazepini]|uniref:class II aldolase/adducin family protein n=1 Tax=Nocardioides carbamazepini TaxID=2854259 RepID=UPI00214A0464|nr:class II aldolase/adducin family protein [Nocardioides carbamazepini]MCR1785125.1 class II aldolase/adducin family protein [Nocardioides carbamazepini]
MSDGPAGRRQEVAAAARRLAAAGLLVGTAGNVSARAGDRVAITATGIALGACTADDVTVVSLDGEVIDGTLEPTSELGLHLGVYADSPAAAVVHTHAPFATALACVLDALPVLHYQQLALGGEIRVAPYATFGTGELAAHVRAALDGRSAALLANHGSVTVGGTLDAAVENALLLEWLCQLHHRASTLGTPRALTEAQQSDVVRAAIERGYGTPKSLPA